MVLSSTVRKRIKLEDRASCQKEKKKYEVVLFSATEESNLYM